MSISQTDTTVAEALGALVRALDSTGAKAATIRILQRPTDTVATIMANRAALDTIAEVLPDRATHSFNSDRNVLTLLYPR